MDPVRVAAVQGAYVLMDRDATIDRVAGPTAAAAREGAQLVVFPEAFVPGTPIWIDIQPVWEGDEDYNRPDIFRLCVDTSPRPAVTETPLDHLRSPS